MTGSVDKGIQIYKKSTEKSKQIHTQIN